MYFIPSLIDSVFRMDMIDTKKNQIRIAVTFCVYFFAGLFSLQAQSTDADKPVENAKMQWFKDAKLGIFIHWGIYAVNGIDESWSFFNEYISHEDYLKQVDGFTASKYDPKQWVSLIKNSGAKYAVITAKHHDGFALWDTQYGALNVINAPAARDLISPFVKELRRQKLKVGLYYSLPDWSYEDYPN